MLSIRVAPRIHISIRISATCLLSHAFVAQNSNYFKPIDHKIVL